MRRHILALALLAAAAPPAAAQSLVSAFAPRLRPMPAHIDVDQAAKPAFERLWLESVMAKEERVACLGGTREGDSVRITRILMLEPSGADSMSVSARTSIDTCGPPDWFGTVHTHIALLDGQRPYERFSGADHGVIMMWWRQWKMEGVFCVLYSREVAHCEVDGVAGPLVMPRLRYGDRPRSDDPSRSDPAPPRAEQRNE